MDISQEQETAEKFNIQTLPTVFFFRNGEPITYTGGRSAQEIVDWANKKMVQGIQTLTTPGELSYIVDEESFFVVGYFSDEESPEYKELFKYFIVALQATKLISFLIFSRKMMLDKFTITICLF